MRNCNNCAHSDYELEHESLELKCGLTGNFVKDDYVCEKCVTFEECKAVFEED